MSKSSAQAAAILLTLSVLLLGQQAFAEPAVAPATSSPAAASETTASQLPAVTSVETQPPASLLEAQVSTVAAPVEPAAKDYFEITNVPGDLNGHSKSKYRALSITLKNTRPFHVEILQGEVTNGLDEASIAQAEQRSRQRKKQAVGFLMRAASVAPGIGMLGAGSYNSAYALAQTSRALSMASNVVASTPTGNLEISGQFVNKLSNVIISPNQTFTFKTLLPAGVDPQMKLIFKNLETSKILEL